MPSEQGSDSRVNQFQSESNFVINQSGELISKASVIFLASALKA